MKLSYFIQPVHPFQKDYRRCLEEDIQSIILADQLGYNEAFVGEHFTDLVEPVTSTLMFLARLIPETRDIKLGSGVVNLPVYHPAMLAGHIAMMDHLCDGRFIWGIGPGGQPSDIEAFGNREIDRNAKMIEVFDQIMEIWWGDAPYDLKGEFHSISTTEAYLPEIGQGIAPKPLHKPHPPVVVTAVNPYAKGITLAAERDWHPISCQYVQAHWVATHLPKYLEGLKNADQPENPLGWRVAKMIFVADDAATAERYARAEDGPYGHYFYNLMTKLSSRGRQGLFAAYPDQPVEEITLEQSLRTQVIAGTADHVVDQLLKMRDLIGPFGTIVYTGADWADEALGKRSMELMAEHVMPRLNDVLKDEEAEITARVTSPVAAE